MTTESIVFAIVENDAIIFLQDLKCNTTINFVMPLLIEPTRRLSFMCIIFLFVC